MLLFQAIIGGIFPVGWGWAGLRGVEMGVGSVHVEGVGGMVLVIAKSHERGTLEFGADDAVEVDFFWE